MSTMSKIKKVTIKDIQKKFNCEQKITMTTAYDYTMAKIVDASDIDIILVGDSLGMVVQGEKTTLPVEMEHMIYHTKCVSKAAERAHVVADLPFLSYQTSHDDAVKNAGRMLKAGAESIKIEGGEEFADLIWYLHTVGIPVMAHIGIQPQSINTQSGYRIQGKSKVSSDDLFNQAQALEDAGAYAIVLEGVAMEVAKEISETVKIPTIGIGSGPHCTGQVLVSYDMLGATSDFKPKFVRQYMNLFDEGKEAFNQFVTDVNKGSFPSEKESTHRNLVEVKTGTDSKE